MVHRDEMMGVLLDACPSFTEAWQAFLDDWREEAGLPLYVGLGRLSHHMVELLESGQQSEVARTFRAVERLLLEGDEYVSNAVHVGLLENLHNGGLHTRTQPGQFFPFLGSEGRRRWAQLDGR